MGHCPNQPKMANYARSITFYLLLCVGHKEPFRPKPVPGPARQRPPGTGSCNGVDTTHISGAMPRTDFMLELRS